MVYQEQYHRCIFNIDLTWKKLFYSLIPFVAIIVMYTAMLIFLRKAKVESKRFLVTSFLIIATGLVAYLPDQLLIAFKVRIQNWNHFQLTLLIFVLYWNNWVGQFLNHKSLTELTIHLSLQCHSDPNELRGCSDYYSHTLVH